MDPETFTIILTDNNMDTNNTKTRTRKEWSVEEDIYLREGVASGLTAPDMAPDLGRTTPAVYSRMNKLGLKRTRQRETAHPLEEKDEWTILGQPNSSIPHILSNDLMHLRARIKFARDVAVLSLWLSIIAIGLAIFSLTQT